MKIKSYTSYQESTKTHFYNNLEVIESIPEVYSLEKLISDTSLKSWLDNDKCIEVKQLELDAEQGNSEVYNYDFYELTYVDIADYHYSDNEDKEINDFLNTKCVCVKIED